ncbi:unnamed protein product [Ceratitis capitata]|uniref:(Mediterranean fruit fly) hypothetical protein n=1 Tax=Ceratitis capitata TaxID=7213 RepID=A0A811VEX6_CERCA|nr:unnamed protein product [Ceratitis capitata]
MTHFPSFCISFLPKTNSRQIQLKNWLSLTGLILVFSNQLLFRLQNTNYYTGHYSGGMNAECGKLKTSLENILITFSTPSQYTFSAVLVKYTNFRENMYRFLLLFTFFALHSQVEATNIVELVNNLSRELGVTTNIIYAEEGATHLPEIASELTQPKIIINANISCKVRETFDTPLLAVVLLNNEFSSEHGIHKIVLSTLVRLQHTDVIFYAPHELTAATENWLTLMTLYFNSGFHNLLIADKRAQLQTIQTFPQLQLMRTSFDAYLQQRQTWWRDLKGLRLRISYAHDPPRTLIYRQRSTGQRQYTGAAPQIFAAFAQRYNATIEPWIAPNSADFNIDHVCSERLRARVVDACSDWGVYSAESVVSTPLQLYNCYLVVRYAPPLSKLYYFQVPFQPAVWLLLGVSIFFVTVVTSLLARLQCGEWRLGRLGLNVCASFLYLAFDLRPLGWHLRSQLFLTLFVGGFMLSNLYIGYLSSILGKSVYEPQIRTLEDFRRSNITVMAHEYQDFVFQQYGVPAVIADRLLIVSYEEFLVHRNNFDTQYAYMNPEITQELFMYQQKLLRRPLMRKLPNPILVALAGHAIKEGWPLEEVFNKHSLEMFAAGLYKRLKEEANAKTILLGYVDFAKRERLDVKPLGMEYIAMPALLLGCGYSIALITLLLELLRDKMLARKKLY